MLCWRIPFSFRSAITALCVQVRCILYLMTGSHSPETNPSYPSQLKTAIVEFILFRYVCLKATNNDKSMLSQCSMSMTYHTRRLRPPRKNLGVAVSVKFCRNVLKLFEEFPDVQMPDVGLCLCGPYRMACRSKLVQAYTAKCHAQVIR